MQLYAVRKTGNIDPQVCIIAFICCQNKNLFFINVKTNCAKLVVKIGGFIAGVSVMQHTFKEGIPTVELYPSELIGYFYR